MGSPQLRGIRPKAAPNPSHTRQYAPRSRAHCPSRKAPTSPLAPAVTRAGQLCEVNTPLPVPSLSNRLAVLLLWTSLAASVVQLASDATYPRVLAADLVQMATAIRCLGGWSLADGMMNTLVTAYACMGPLIYQIAAGSKGAHLWALALYLIGVLPAIVIALEALTRSALIGTRALIQVGRQGYALVLLFRPRNRAGAGPGEGGALGRQPCRLPERRRG